MTAIDCSQPLETGMPVYPDDDPVEIRQHQSVPADGACMRQLSLSTHVGTHIDAPSHKVEDGATLSDFPVSAFHFDARLVDCRPCDPRQRLTVDDLPADVREAGVNSRSDDAADGSAGNPMLVFVTGWSDHWGSERYRDSPYLGPELARWCAAAGYHVGVEAFSPDPVPSAAPEREGDDEPSGTPAHAALCGSERFIVENLRAPERLPDRCTLETYPLAIAEGDGSPVRAVARTDA